MISVLIPIYNTSKYLSQCIDSVRKQNFKDLEIVLINDASTDDSLAICRRYESKDPRVVVIDKKINEGVEKARLSGIMQAKGEYICFLDSDDWLQDKALAVMYERIQETGADYVEVNVQRVLDKHKLIKKTGNQSVVGKITQPELFDKYYISFFGQNLLSVTLWGKLYRTEFVRRYLPGASGLKMGEDLYFNMCLFPHLKSVYIDSYVGYNYRFGGMTGHYNPSLLPNLKVLYRMKKQLISKYRYDKASMLIIVELRNVLLSDIEQRILFEVAERKEILSWLEQELKDEIWVDAEKLKELDSSSNSCFDKALMSKDVQVMYDICAQRVRKEYRMWRLKRIVSRLLSWF